MNGVPPGSAWDLRFYDVQPYRVEDYMRELMAVMPVREKHSLPFGIWRQVSGPIDRIVHLWPYRDLAHRNEARAGVIAPKLKPNSTIQLHTPHSPGNTINATNTTCTTNRT